MKNRPKTIPVEVHNSDYAVYAVSNSEYEKPKEGDGSESNPYKISNSSQLFWFAQQVNDKGETTISAVLTTNIVVNKNVLNANGTLNSSSTLTEWTPIGNESNKYTGTFDGQNHTISGLYFDKSTAFVGLFGYNKGTIKNVGIIDSYFKGFNRVGGVCGENNSKIENSYNTGLVSGSGNNVGGICGNNFDTIENSYNTGTVSGSGNDVGGICGDNGGTIANSYNTGSVSGANYVGGVCGINDTNCTVINSYNTGSVSGSSKVGSVCGDNWYGTIEKSYYNNSVYSGEAVGYNINGTVNKVSGKTSGQFASGEVAFSLGGIWGQEIGKDKLPILNGKKVYENKTYTGCCEKYQGDITYVYSNIQKDAVYLKETHNFKNGICTGCGTYEPPELKDGYYQIENVNHLYWFAKQVNNVDTKINAVLTADIVVNKNVLNADGILNNSLTNLIEWTPIGNKSNKYTGIFDGQNHTISGLYFNNSTNCVGLFGYNSGTIKNVGMIDSYFKGKDYVSDVCAINYGTIESSYNASTVSGSKWVGGICAVNYATIKDSYNTGSVSGSNQIGGVCGHNFTKDTMTTPCIIENIYNTGSVSGSGNYVGGVCGINDTNCTVINIYNTGSVSGSDNYVGAVCGYNYGTIKSNYYLENCNADGTKFTNNYGTKKTAKQFASGEVAYRLGGIWGQEIEKDKLPVLNGKKVYQNIIYSGCCEKYHGDITYDYSNTQKDAVYLKETHNFKNGICTGCGTYEPPELKDGYYQIENVNHLYWFAKQVNSGNKGINAVLTADIVVNQNLLNKDGTLNTALTGLVEWTPIGNGYSNRYKGTFDGNNHTISGLYFNDEGIDNVGLFSWNSGTIKNIGIIDSYFNGSNFVGGVCGV